MRHVCSANSEKEDEPDVHGDTSARDLFVGGVLLEVNDSLVLEND